MPQMAVMTRFRIPSFSQGGSLVGIQISLSTMSLGRLHNNQEETVITIQVRLVGMLICHNKFSILPYGT